MLQQIFPILLTRSMFMVLSFEVPEKEMCAKFCSPEKVPSTRFELISLLLAYGLLVSGEEVMSRTRMLFDRVISDSSAK